MNPIYHFVPAEANLEGGIVQKGFLENVKGERWQVTVTGDTSAQSNAQLNRVITTFIQCSASRSIYQLEYHDKDKSFRILDERQASQSKQDKHYTIVISKAILAEEKGPSKKIYKVLENSSTFGKFTGPLDHDVLRDGVIRSSFRKVEGRPTRCFDFTINNTPQLPKDCEVRYGRHVFKGPDQENNFTSQNGMEVYGSKDMEIAFKGIGIATIGLPTDVESLKGFVNIEIDDSANLSQEEIVERLEFILNNLGLSDILTDPEESFDEKMRLEQMQKAFSPEVCPERTLMRKEEILPGVSAWKIPDYGEQMRKNGGWGLMVGVGGLESDITNVWKNAAVLLQNGFYSTEKRLQGGLGQMGGSCGEDLDSGGALSVFTRAINNNLSKTPISNYPFRGPIQFLIDFEAVTPDSYANHKDNYGKRSNANENLISFAGRTTSSTNEVMIPYHIPPRYIRGVVVQSEEHKAQLIRVWKQEGLISEQGSIRNVPVDRFIHVIPENRPFTKELWVP